MLNIKEQTHYKAVNATLPNFPTEHSYNKYSQMPTIMTHVIFIITIRIGHTQGTK